MYAYIIVEKLSLILEKGSAVEEIMLYQKVKILFNIFKVIVDHVLWFCFVYFSFEVGADKEEVRKIRHFSWA